MHLLERTDEPDDGDSQKKMETGKLLHVGLSNMIGRSVMPRCSNLEKSEMSGVASGVKLVDDESKAVKVDCCVMVDT